MRRLLVILLAVLALPAAARAATPHTSLADVEDEVMCITCGTALNVSEAPSADRERAFIVRQIGQGKTKAQVKAALVDEYGRNVLADPKSPAAWVIPVVLALLAVATIGVTIARWRRRTRGRRGGDESADVGLLDPADAARLDRDMAAFDR